jgi:hypothetical protein
MKFAEITRRLTGLSCPIFGVSWNPPEAEVTATRRVLVFLEDRRVLYSPTELELPAHCIQSVLVIRQYLTSELARLEALEELASSLRAMRAACRKFLDRMQAPDIRASSLSMPVGGYVGWVFCASIGELRSTFGTHIAQLAARNGLDVEDALAIILPAADADGA